MQATLALMAAFGEQGKSYIGLEWLQLSGTMSLLAENAIHFAWSNPKRPSCHRKSPPWSKVDVDLCTLDKTEYITIVDDYSNSFELWALSDTRALSVISLKSQFAMHRIPNIVRSDNGSQFSSSDFKTLAREWDFEHITSSPYRARSNGKVEKAVQ